MKKVIAFMLVVMVSVGCATKEERAKTNLTRTWEIFKVYQNDQDVTEAYLSNHINYRLTFNGDGDFEEKYFPESGGALVTINGTWLFSDGIRKITLTDNNQSRIFEIDLLDEDNFNIIDLGSTNGRRFELVAD